MNALTTKTIMLHSRAITLPGRTKTRLRNLREDGQGTTEYAILVGVLAVIAIIAIAAFRTNLQDLWNGIRDNINEIKRPTKDA